MAKRVKNIINTENILVWLAISLSFTLWGYVLMNQEQEKEINVKTHNPCDEFANNLWIVANTRSRVLAVDKRQDCDKLTDAILADMNKTAQYLINFLKNNHMNTKSCTNVLCCADLNSIDEPGVFELLYGIESLVLPENREELNSAHVRAHQRCRTFMRGGPPAEILYNKTIQAVKDSREKKCTTDFLKNTGHDELLREFLNDMMNRMKDGQLCALQYFANNGDYAEKAMKEWLKYLKYNS